MTMMLSVIMVTGIFAGMKVEVRAAKNYSIDLSDPGSFMFALQNTYYSDDTLVFLTVFPSHQQAINISI